MKAAVIGGGFAGLAAALTLAERGHEVFLLERRGVLGGRATSFADAVTGDDIDSGVHFLFEGCRSAVDFLRRQDADRFLRRDVPWPDAGVDAALAAWLRERQDAVHPAIAAAVRRELVASTGAARPVFFGTGLRQIHEQLARRLLAHGGTIRRRALVERLDVEHGRVRRVRFVQRAETREAIRAGRRASRESLELDAAILAVPWHALPGLLDESAGGPTLAAVSGLPAAPAVSIEAWIEDPLPLELVIAPGDPAVDLILEKGRLHGRQGPPQHLAFSISRDESRRERSNAEWAGIARRALAATVGHAATPPFERTVVLREKAAFFGCDHESRRLRGAAACAAAGVYLAGDWTEPDLPACIEGAIRSGLRAAAEAEALGRRTTTPAAGSRS